MQWTKARQHVVQTGSRCEANGFDGPGFTSGGLYPFSSRSWNECKSATLTVKTLASHACHKGRRMFRLNALARSINALAITTCLAWSAEVFAAGEQRTNAKPAAPHAGESTRNDESERKLLVRLESALDALADPSDAARLDRELAAAFRDYGLDLGKADSKTAAARLAGLPSTPAIAAVIDRWCQLCRTNLKVATWRRLADLRGPPIPIPGGTQYAINSTNRRPPACRCSSNEHQTRRHSTNSRSIAYWCSPTCSRMPLTGRRRQSYCGSPKNVFQATTQCALSKASCTINDTATIKDRRNPSSWKPADASPQP